jgi:hypothetical protein
MSSNPPKRKFSAFELIQGKTYLVIADFVDYDGLAHKVGENWSFVGHDFLPYDDGLTIYIVRDGKNSVFLCNPVQNPREGLLKLFLIS